mgnify:CR=1 FL=1
MQNPLKILLLEDSTVDAEIIKRLLEQEMSHCTFKLVMTKTKFLSELDAFSPDVILSDNSLPKFDATEALKIVRQRALHIPFILLTGAVSEEYAAGIIKLGADDYILKDRMARLPAVIDSALRYRQGEKEKLEAEQQKEFDRNNLFALINNTADLMWSVDNDLNLITFNDSFTKINELTSGKRLVKGDYILSTQFTNAQVIRYKTFYERALSGETFTIIDHFVRPVEFWSEISFYPIRNGNEVIGTACFSRDITGRKKSESELKKMETALFEQQRKEQLHITATALEAQEKERKAIGIELHDNVNQILVSTKLILSLAIDEPGQTQALINSSMDNLQNAIEENRKIAHTLVAPDFEEKVLTEQLANLADNMLTNAGIGVHIDDSSFSEDLLDDAQKLAVYRIAQEQCANILKYAKARIVKIDLRSTSSLFEMTMADDGVGMETGKKPNGIGISNIKGRLSIFNGTATIDTAPGKGFILQITIPLLNPGD